MKLAIISYHFEPEITPRAFRASSIYKTIKKLGYEVDLITPKKSEKATCDAKTNQGNTSRSILSIFKSKLGRFIEYTLPGGKDLRALPFYISNLKNKNYDAVISIGLPFSVHLAVALSIKYFNLKAQKVIFDYGDPYSSNPNGNYCFYARHIEAWVLNHCDYILTPVQSAVSLFEKLKPIDCEVIVSPQGYDLENYSLGAYIKNEVPTFCYAGLLYKGIREPNNFFKFLSTIELDYKFIVYTDVSNSECIEILNKYPNNRIKIKPMIPREDCIYEQSKMDFLINFSNLGGVQQPSKLVDYTLSGRPFISISSKQSDFSEFNYFFDFNFSSFRKMDINKFDQNVVVKNILKLIRNEN